MPEKISLNTEAPDFSLTDYSGGPVRLSDWGYPRFVHYGRAMTDKPFNSEILTILENLNTEEYG